MNSKITDAIPGIVSRLGQVDIPGKTAFLGFDACIDSIVRVVKDKQGNEIAGYFSDSDQLGKYLVDLENKSCGLELETKLSKIGGNMVIMGNALGNLGVYVECLGTFGLPEILPVFRSMSPNCSLYTIGDTITATALEFNNSKVIMFDPGPYNNLSWKDIKGLIGTDRIREMITGKQLMALVNWSEIENSSHIWKGILEEILPDIPFNGQKPFFFTDFSDCSRKSMQEIQIAIGLLGRFRNYYKVHISLNQNEAALVARALDLPENDSDEKFIKELFKRSNADVLVIHRVNDAIAFDGKSYEKCDTFFCKEPKILTGGGDNFNAGYCYTLFNSFTLFESLLVANAVSGSYVKTGVSPDVNDLKEFLNEFSG